MTSENKCESNMVWTIDDNLNNVVSHLSEGDQVLIDDRSLPLEVFDTGLEKMGSDRYPTETVYLEGRNGRVYCLRGEYAPNTEINTSPTPPCLELRQEGTWEQKARAITRIELAEGQQMLSDTTVDDWIENGDFNVR